MAGGVSGYSTAAASFEGQKRKRENPTGVWYMFYGKSSVKQMGLQDGQAVLQFHPELNLLHRGTVRASMKMPQRRPAVHWVILLGPV